MLSLLLGSSPLFGADSPERVPSEPDANELVQKALARLSAKRLSMKEQAEAQQSAAETALANSREKTAAVLVTNMIPVPGLSCRMGRTEVTQSQWEGVMGNNPSTFQYPDHPVESVSWYDVGSFLKTLNAIPTVQKRGLRFRLPYWSEWLHACHAGGTGQFGLLKNGVEGLPDEMAWYVSTTYNGDMTRAVAEKTPNAWGFYDMHGNVAEFVVILTPDNVGWAVGGHYASWHYNCTCLSQQYVRDKLTRSSGIGFRLCVDEFISEPAAVESEPKQTDDGLDDLDNTSGTQITKENKKNK